VKLDAGLSQRGPDGGVVLEVAGEAIELVDHETVDAWILGKAGEHGLELGSVGGAGRLAAVDVLVGELPAPVGEEPAASLGLRGD